MVGLDLAGEELNKRPNLQQWLGIQLFRFVTYGFGFIYGKSLLTRNAVAYEWHARIETSHKQLPPFFGAMAESGLTQMS